MTVTTASDALTGQDFALISWGHEALVLPQEAIHSLEAAADVEIDTSVDDACFGHIGKEQTAWPVYVVGQRQLQDGITDDRRFVVLLKNGADSYGLFCNDFKLLDSSRICLYAVPACMQDPNALLSALLLHDGEVYAIGNTAALLRFIREQMR